MFVVQEPQAVEGWCRVVGFFLSLSLRHCWPERSAVEQFGLSLLGLDFVPDGASLRSPLPPATPQCSFVVCFGEKWGRVVFSTFCLRAPLGALPSFSAEGNERGLP